MKVRRVEDIPHVRTVVFRLAFRLAVFPTKLLYVLLRTFPPSPVSRLWRVFCRAPKSPSWRPSVRLTTGRYVKDQHPTVSRRMMGIIPKRRAFVQARPDTIFCCDADSRLWQAQKDVRCRDLEARKRKQRLPKVFQ